MGGQYIEPMADLETVPVTAAPGRRRLGLGVPGQCEVCRSGCRGGGLCSACIGRFARPAPRCGRCALRLGLVTPACGSCQRSPPPFTRTVCVADYGFPWDRLITAFKFEDQPMLARCLAPLLAQRVQDAERAAGAAPGAADASDALADSVASVASRASGTGGQAAASAHAGPPAQLVLPVPLSPRRLAERGYNQAWELARRVARLRGLPAHAELLQRPVDTAHQAALGRAERQANLRQAFMVDPRRRATLAGLHVALVDDVMTTGATVREAAAVLLRAGAASVQVWVLARTPDD